MPQLPSLATSLPPTPPEGVNTKANTTVLGEQVDLNDMGFGNQEISLDSIPLFADFGSKAANLEYSILSNILQNSNEGSPKPDHLPYPHKDRITPESSISSSSSDAEKGRMLAELVDHSRPRSTSVVEDRHPEEIYASVTKPYSYTQAFHALVAYLRSRFDRQHLMHMARAMAEYRPSFIATTKTLKEEDLIFMEKCFQRTLYEFEKIIAVSGTPTIVWRRTGQIAAVGEEFCVLTGWTQEQLLTSSTPVHFNKTGSPMFIVELMDDKSVVDYFDVFSTLAFGDSRGVTMTECTLLNPAGEKIPTACTWTVKRDVFDIPMMIIGNFLPIL